VTLPSPGAAVGAEPPERLASGRRRVLAWAAACAGAGVLHALAVSYPAMLWWLQIGAVMALVGAMERVLAPAQVRPLAAAAALGWAFGFAWLAASVWWLFISMHRYGGLPAWLAALAVALLCAFLASYLALAAWGWARWRTGRVLPDALLFAALWLLAELARAVLFTGFPWAAAGYAHVDGPLRAWAPWVGVYGIGAVAAGLAAGAALLLVRPGAAAELPARRGGLATVVLAAGLAVGPAASLVLEAAAGGGFTRGAGSLQVSLLQGNVPQDQKFVEEHLPATLAWHVRVLTTARGDLVVAPETAIPLLPEQMPEGLWAMLQQRFADGTTHALVGVPLGSFEAGYTNSVAGFAPGRAGEYRYDKHHLVPFGEFIPFGFRWFTDLMNIPLGDFRRGPLNAPSFVVGAQRVAPNICYEDLFGEELAARFGDPATAPTLFANVSNIGWFGDTIAVGQHLNISRMRALEFQRPMLRATNTGATAVISHTGRVTHALAPFTQGVLEGSVEGRTGLTPFAWWAARGGVWPLAVVAVLVVVAVARGRRS
jgi:apolipoprotein N-acyltransferase